MCVPKRSPAQQRTHESMMRSINRGKRNHPRHHNNLVYVAACIACAVLGFAVVSAAAFFMAPTPDQPPATGTTTPRSIP